MNNPPDRQKLIVIVGPTASGKSDLALRLALRLNSGQAKLAQGKLFKKMGILGAEIISADSRQVYRGMDIGTGKVLKDKTLPVPNLEFKILNNRAKPSSGLYGHLKLKNGYYSSGIRHYLLNVANPKKQFTASDFKRLGEKAIKEIVAKNKIPVIVGGTGFYIDILLDRMHTADVKPNKKLRAELEKQSTEQLFKRLQRLDPAFSKVIDRHNKRRLIRALEIVILTGKPVPPLPTLNTKYLILNTPYQVLWLGINPGNEKLAKNIKLRLDTRLKQGMIKEVDKLRKDGIGWKRLDDFGLEYRWISRWLIENAKIKMQNDNAKLKNFKKSDHYKRLLSEIIKYSKRQMTWFKRNKEINWIENRQDTDKKITAFLSR